MVLFIDPSYSFYAAIDKETEFSINRKVSERNLTARPLKKIVKHAIPI